MRTVIWFIYFWLYLVCVYPVQRSLEHKKEKGGLTEKDRERLDRIVRKWALRLLALAGVTYTVKGKENIPKDRAVLFTPNHQGYFDIPLVITQLDRVNPLVAKKELARLPLVVNWMNLIDCLFLDRGHPRSSVKVFSEMEKMLKGGRSVIIFPEGTRSKGDELGEFKEGAFKAALKTGVPIVPVAIDGSYKAMEANNMKIHPAHVNITILPAVETDKLGREEAKHIGFAIRDMIDECKTSDSSAAAL